ncbi:MAG: TldD/PmbA family protein [Myxococcota bacterium]
MESAERWFDQFGVDDAIVRRVLSEATALGADDADVFFEHSVSTAVGLSDNVVNRAHTTIDLGMGVRVVVGDQVGYAYTEDLELESLLHAARTARSIARSGTTQAVPVLARRKVPDLYPVDLRWSDVALDVRVPMVRRWEELAFAKDPRVRKVRASLADSDTVVMVARADGTIVTDYRPMTDASVSVTAMEGDLRETGNYNISLRGDRSVYTPDREQRLVDQAVDRALLALSATSPPAGEMPVVLAAGSSGILLHEAIGHGMEADFNRKNVSIYADKIGKEIAKPFVNIVDDATAQFARGAINVDDEGNPAGVTRLVDKGVLTTYLHDAISAKHYRVAPTGNGRRQSYQFAPMPRMRATYMLPGPHKRDEIIASVKKGIYCDNFSNGQVQIGAGDFTFYVKNGFLIEDGKLTRPIKDVNIIGNGPKVLEKVDMVADDLIIDEGGWTCGKDGQMVPVSQGMPTVRVASITVGGRGQKA